MFRAESLEAWTSAPMGSRASRPARRCVSLVPSIPLRTSAARGRRPWLATLLLTLVAMLGLTGHAIAHPHVFVDANAELIFDEAGRIKGVGNVWRFDDAFSAFAVEGLDANGDGTLDGEELQPLARINVESLADFGYFSHLAINGVEQAFTPPTEYWLQ